MPLRIAMIAGSLRRESYNRRLAQAAIKLAPPALAFDEVEIGGLSLYNQDLDASPPESWIAFRDQIRRQWPPSAISRRPRSGAPVTASGLGSHSA